MDLLSADDDDDDDAPATPFMFLDTLAVVFDVDKDTMSEVVMDIVSLLVIAAELIDDAWMILLEPLNEESLLLLLLLWVPIVLARLPEF
jgi:hypothetical protein